MMASLSKHRNQGGVWWLLLVVPFLLGAKPTEEHSTTPCEVAREMAIKGVFIFDHQTDQGIAAIEKAYQMCPTEFGIGFNLGLAHYMAGNLERASSLWKSLHAVSPDHEKTLANLAWVQFELGKDREAHRLAAQGMLIYPNNWALAHTKVFSLFRVGDYLEAYDWLSRSGLSGMQATQWRQQAATYVVETQWRKFRKNKQIQAIQQAVNLLVKWYPDEPRFVQAKDRLLLAHLDENADIPYPIDLPHETWKKTGNVDDQSVILDEHIRVLSSLAEWEKRSDAFAVIAGISRYARLRARHFSDRDATNMRQLLVGRGMFKDDVDHIRLRVNQEATRNTLTSDLEWLVRQGQLNPNAMLIFYFSGLGVSWSPGETNTMEDALLVPVGARMGEINPETTISLLTLKRALEKLPNRDIIVILDTCFNETMACAVYDTGTNPAQGDGRRPVESIQTFFKTRHPWVVAALKQGATLHSAGRQGSLTYFLLKGMLGGGDGADGGQTDGWVTLSEAVAFAKKAMHGQEPDLFLSQPTRTRLTKTAGEK